MFSCILHLLKHRLVSVNLKKPYSSNFPLKVQCVRCWVSFPSSTLLLFKPFSSFCITRLDYVPHNDVCVCVVADYFSPDMLGLKVDQEVLGELVRVKIPGVWQTMVDQNVTWTLVVSRWFICLYIDVLPVEVIVSVCASRCSQEGSLAIVATIYLFYLLSGVECL